MAVFNKFQVPIALRSKKWCDELLETTKNHCRDSAKNISKDQLAKGTIEVQAANDKKAREAITSS